MMQVNKSAITKKTANLAVFFVLLLGIRLGFSVLRHQNSDQFQ